MTNLYEEYIKPNISLGAFSRVRRNHGLEHATLHVLAEKYPKKTLAGHSNATGFFLVGDIETWELRKAVETALARMKAGEHNLAVHPNCGTNYVAAGTVAGLAGAAAMLGSGRRLRDKLERFPLAAALATVGLILAQPLGLKLQEKVTTNGDPGGLEIVDVIPAQKGSIRAHRVITRG